MPKAKAIRITYTCGQCGKFFEQPTYNGPRKFCSPKCYHDSCVGTGVPMEVQFASRLGETTPTGCILWTGSVNEHGYGFLSVGTSRKNRRNKYAHRISYELKHGPIPSDMKVLHRCDNPPCVNPDHLFLGTHSDNVADKIAKGRGAKGEQAGPSKLTESQVIEIRRRYALGGISIKNLAAEFGMTFHPVWCIIRNRTWTHV